MVTKLHTFIETKLLNSLKSRYFLIHCISLAWLSHILLAYPLWLPNLRSFPQIHATELPIFFSSFQRYFLYILALFSLFIANYNLRYYKIAITIFLFVFFLTILEDINRLQPYFYFYSLIFVSIALHIKIPKNSHIPINTYIKSIEIDLYVLLGACYFWSGIYKCNELFPNLIFNLLNRITYLGTLLSKIPEETYYAISLFEILLGIWFFYLAITCSLGLIYFKKIKFWYIFLASLLHFSIILILLLSKWNTIVITWNICIIVILILIFLNYKNDEIVVMKNNNFSKIKHLLFAFIVAILPALHIFGLWDSYLSWELYSANLSQKNYYFNNYQEYNEQKIIPKQLLNSYKIIYYDKKQEKYYINISNWLMAETRTSLYAEPRYIEKLLDSLERKK